MKITEIFDYSATPDFETFQGDDIDSFEESLFDAITKYTGNSHHTPKGRLSKHFIETLVNHPKGKQFLYEGPMFRFLEFHKSEFENPPSLEKIVSMGGVASFTKSATDMKNLLMKYHTVSEDMHMVFIKQNGYGIDTSKVFEYYKNNGFGRNELRIIQRAASVNEVIGPYDSSAEILK